MLPHVRPDIIVRCFVVVVVVVWCSRIGLVVAVLCLVWSTDIHNSIGVFGDADLINELANCIVIALFCAQCSVWVWFWSLSISKQLFHSDPPYWFWLLLIAVPSVFGSMLCVAKIGEFIENRRVWDSLFTITFAIIGLFYAVAGGTAYIQLRAVLLRFLQNNRPTPSASSASSSPISHTHGGVDTSHVQRALDVMALVICIELPLGLLLSAVEFYLFATRLPHRNEPALPPPATLSEAAPLIVLDLCGWIMESMLCWYSFPIRSPPPPPPPLLAKPKSLPPPPLPSTHITVTAGNTVTTPPHPHPHPTPTLTTDSIPVDQSPVPVTPVVVISPLPIPSSPQSTNPSLSLLPHTAFTRTASN